MLLERVHNEDSRVYIENKIVYGLHEVANKPTCMNAERKFIASRDNPVLIRGELPKSV